MEISFYQLSRARSTLIKSYLCQPDSAGFDCGATNEIELMINGELNENAQSVRPPVSLALCLSVCLSLLSFLYPGVCSWRHWDVSYNSIVLKVETIRIPRVS